MVKINFTCGHCWYWSRDYGTNKGVCKHSKDKETTASDTCQNWQPCGENAYKRRWADRYARKIWGG